MNEQSTKAITHDYLTEESLGLFLQEYLPGNWMHNKAFITKARPDYRNEDRKLIVEFDGYGHYIHAKQICNDIAKDELYKANGYSIIRIPYFILLTHVITKQLFGISIDYSDYKHGFVDEKCILPADFCELGLVKFKDDCKRFSCVLPEIIKSIEEKIEKMKDIDCVIPASIQSLFYLHQ